MGGPREHPALLGEDLRTAGSPAPGGVWERPLPPCWVRESPRLGNRTPEPKAAGATEQGVMKGKKDGPEMPGQ